MNIHFVPNIPLSPFTATRNLQLHQGINKYQLYSSASLTEMINPLTDAFKKIYDTFSWLGQFFWQIHFAGDRRDVSNNEIIGRRQYWLRCLRLWLRDLGPVETRPWTDTGPWAARSQACTLYTGSEDTRQSLDEVSDRSNEQNG